jgi:hypothetical protein
LSLLFSELFCEGEKMAVGSAEAMNKEWHKQHTMPSGATEKQRIEWHLEHTKHCGCRPFPKGLAEKVKKQGTGNTEHGSGA